MSNRKIRLSVFAVAIVVGVLILFQTFHYSDDFKMATALLGDDTKENTEANNILVSNTVVQGANSEDKLQEANSVIKVSGEDKEGSRKDLTEKPGEQFNPEKEFMEILSFSPVVIFSKTYCPYSQRLKSLLKNDYELTPEPIIVELDKHKHGAELQTYIGQQSGRRTVPNLYVKGVSRGGSDDIRELHDKGELLDLLTTWGNKSLKVTKHSVPSNS
ncbi:glutathione-disulfide reductase [Saccharomycopsis crataegensis]|uniref:Glutathione-disulfide reductase n=1 Tax=Saccharomycopsis crataegensis TaxID=43959 RepID=A0AAV5QI96_9ASCO|nr:glutathione-disulfide reductase [Saccharomycopsis crataegensis]